MASTYSYFMVKQTNKTS